MSMQSRFKWFVAIAVVLTLLILSRATTAFAQGPTRNIDNEVLRIAKGLYCPVCPATPLDVCETQACVQWRALIKEKLLKGETEQQIRDYFVAQYGERVLGAPTPEGFNLTAYVLPFVLVLAGAGILFLTLRGWRVSRERASHDAPEVFVSPEYAKRIALELKEQE